MNAALLKQKITEKLWQVVDSDEDVVSATLTGSFLRAHSLDGLSDIDFVVVVRDLNATRYQRLLAQCQAALEPVLASYGYALRLNPTLGPLKFNEERLAVLHLMLYSTQAHVDHVIQSPFTCLDWQQTGVWRKHSLAECYPAFGLQPRHFISARRGIAEYLKDYRNRCVSYRDLVCDDDGYHEVKQTKPMTERDRYEFAYHVMRFLMRNILKLAFPTRDAPSDTPTLLESFFRWFPESASEFGGLFHELAKRKMAVNFAEPIEALDDRLEAFVMAFERQFREEFVDGAKQHIAFRHAPTAMHRGETRFIGRSDPDILGDLALSPEHQNELACAQPTQFWSSPLMRCRQTMKRFFPGLDDRSIQLDDRLIEMNYGRCEGLTVSEGRANYPELFQAWSLHLDPAFPDGECLADVQERAEAFVHERWTHDGPVTAVCTHNVVLRCLIGAALSIDPSRWYRIQVPYMTPISFVRSRRFGLRVNLTPVVEAVMFQNFRLQEDYSTCKS